jgi:hypothetical protein
VALQNKPSQFDAKLAWDISDEKKHPKESTRFTFDIPF